MLAWDTGSNEIMYERFGMGVTKGVDCGVVEWELVWTCDVNELG